MAAFLLYSFYPLHFSSFFRKFLLDFIFADYNGHIYQEIISEMTRRGFVYFDWNRQTGDAVRNSVPVQTLVENALDRASSMRRVFLLAHDSARFTNVVAALPKIIEGYREEGFAFAALTAEVKPVIYNYPA